ncbi:MAG: cysteine peptidase family C39 domain-containing protein [bacterium]|nr:cysteine peptidase family C39 domain-containing protein [bacterium]
MRLQKSNFDCGPTALINALKCFGENYSIEEMIHICKTSRARGTSSRKLKLAIKKVGFKKEAFDTKDKKTALAKLFVALYSYPIILCVDHDDHWVTALALQGERIVIFDPGDNYRNRRENGCHVLSKRQLLKRWKSPHGKYYGLIVFPK